MTLRPILFHERVVHCFKDCNTHLNTYYAGLLFSAHSAIHISKLDVIQGNKSSSEVGNNLNFQSFPRMDC